MRHTGVAVIVLITFAAIAGAAEEPKVAGDCTLCLRGESLASTSH